LESGQNTDWTRTWIDCGRVVIEWRLFGLFSQRQFYHYLGHPNVGICWSSHFLFFNYGTRMESKREHSRRCMLSFIFHSLFFFSLYCTHLFSLFHFHSHFRSSFYFVNSKHFLLFVIDFWLGKCWWQNRNHWKCHSEKKRERDNKENKQQRWGLSTTRECC
jgi:hypothetical protein